MSGVNHASMVEGAAIEAIVALAARTYPNAGNQLEAVARLAARLGWEAARAAQQIEREEALAS